MKAYKGFDRNLQCQGYQYEVGKEYETDKAELCKCGFHACEAPLEVWDYYPPVDGNRYCEVEQSGDIKSEGAGGKSVSAKLKVGAEIGIPGLVKAHVEWVKKNIEQSKIRENTGNRSAATNTGDCSAATNTGNGSAATNTGYCSAATNTGYCSAATNTGNGSAATNTGNGSAATNTGDWSAATNTGDWSAATNTGDWSAATNTGDYSAATNTGYCSAAEVGGKESIAIVTGRDCKARGAVGCWLVLTERDANYHILGVQAVKVDGEKYKPDTWYTLRDGEVVEVKDKEADND